MARPLEGATQAPMTSNVVWIQVANVRRSLARIASLFYGEPSNLMFLAGITGTNGKTTITYLLESIFTKAGMKPGVIGTNNYRFGKNILPAQTTTPESLEIQSLLDQMRRSGVNAATMEVSSHALVQDRAAFCHFDVACFTNLTQDHLDFHKDLNDYFEAKCRLFTELLAASAKRKKTAVLPAADPWGDKISARLLQPRLLQTRLAEKDQTILTYGLSPAASVTAEAIRTTRRGLRAVVKTPQGDFSLTSPLIGEHNLKNILAATAVAIALDISPTLIQEGLQAVASVPGRLEMIPNSLGLQIYVDYAHTPDALENVLRTLRPVTVLRLIVVFGCGGDRDLTKRPLMGLTAAANADLVILTSDNPRTEDGTEILRQIVPGVSQAGKEPLVIPDREEAIRRALSVAEAGDTVLIAGKGHEDYQIIGAEKRHFSDQEVVRRFLDSGGC